VTAPAAGPTAAAPPSAAEAVRASNQHYELPPEFFAAFLDRRLKYSCGLYPREDMTLDAAQTEKLHFIARQLGARPGLRVLDIGCGWGSLALFLAGDYGCQVTAITPSRAQASYVTGLIARDGLADRVRLVAGVFPDVACDDGYDAVAMVGSVNHMPDQQAVLARVARLLTRDGRLYLSESCYASAEKQARFAGSRGARQVAQDIFGYAEMVPLSALVAVIESAGLSITGVTDLTWNFARTVEDWTDRARAAQADIEAVAPGSSAPLLRYLETTNAAWGYTSKHYAVTALRSRLGPRDVG
jgi:cyclopropane-fatty-acyl-phospholipid synthase